MLLFIPEGTSRSVERREDYGEEGGPGPPVMKDQEPQKVMLSMKVNAKAHLLVQKLPCALQSKGQKLITQPDSNPENRGLHSNVQMSRKWAVEVQFQNGWDNAFSLMSEELNASVKAVMCTVGIGDTFFLLDNALPLDKNNYAYAF
ncbi:hypothetical protein A6R68_02870 [Neotoma lepida]|uniref:Uncharacterized protein n=1 Tax=Neotoma lepida TaxID=56216 RepID=A0A1A6GSE5_NEOLE|nr:hypothetical protein A6R68_02870 [Neotoma lepida]